MAQPPTVHTAATVVTSAMTAAGGPHAIPSISHRKTTRLHASVVVRAINARKP